MYGIKNLMNFFHEKTNRKFNDFQLLQKSYCILIYLILTVMCLGFSVVLLPKHANAGTVYGHINCNGSMQCPQRIRFSIHQGKTLIKRVSTDNKRDYRVFLEPGRYEVKINLQGKFWEANIRSSSNPIRQDIYPIRRNGR